MAHPRVAVLAGGVGAAKLLAGMVRAVPPDHITAVVNIGDDLVLHGLHISPDLDTVTYTVAGAIDPERGWGLREETWNAMTALERYGGQTWFSLGDLDIGTHLYRTQRLAEGAPLSTVTGEIARAWGLDLHLTPVTDDPVPTMITLADPEGGAGPEISFQEYFVGRRHAVPVTAVRFAGADEARPAPGVLDTLADADQVVIAPSNPIVSIGPLLAVPGVRETLAARRESVTAISPLVGGRALKGPADRMLRELGYDDSVGGVAGIYAPVCGALVIDHADAGRRHIVDEQGLRCQVADTIMTDAGAAETLCRTVLRDRTRDDAGPAALTKD